jgi:hypothetical protein
MFHFSLTLRVDSKEALHGVNDVVEMLARG